MRDNTRGLRCAPELRVEIGEVRQAQREAEQLLPQRRWQRHRDVDAVVDGQAQQHADQLELRAGLQRVRIEPVHARIGVEFEHAVVRVEQLPRDLAKRTDAQ